MYSFSKRFIRWFCNTMRSYWFFDYSLTWKLYRCVCVLLFFRLLTSRVQIWCFHHTLVERGFGFDSSLQWLWHIASRTYNIYWLQVFIGKGGQMSLTSLRGKLKREVLLLTLLTKSPDNKIFDWNNNTVPDGNNGARRHWPISPKLRDEIVKVKFQATKFSDFTAYTISHHFSSLSCITIFTPSFQYQHCYVLRKVVLRLKCWPCVWSLEGVIARRLCGTAVSQGKFSPFPLTQ